ncbi:MAG: RDD family protein [Pseudomonadota bacterium]
MTSAADDNSDWLNRVRGLPDPVADRQFYDGVALRRLMAFFIDVMLVWGGALVVVVLTFGLGLFILGFIVAVIDLAYRVITISNRSATFGMRAMRIELRNSDGRPFSFGEALLHTLLFYLSLTIFLAHLVSLFMMAGTSLGRGLHDLPLGSAMINSPA